MIPLIHPAKIIDLVESKSKDNGYCYKFKKKVIKDLLLLGVGVAIVFDKLELIIFVSQGLTISTASLVLA